ncbi:rRNA maturation RNase YbeY [Sporolactobacillus nakayamae]|uniref:Endoribonuclease YbeY n=1 Tax=Sporolactobacillus nakayamae TaxID=269670 RepID=A0A1I2NXT9_9BACL|nr:rRNA maturation RNase YbeY [Sporolactobacillus nakayamae]SFG08634.1 probable rRNA maturation factor [Sporolactobacillus nakayamae]
MAMTIDMHDETKEINHAIQESVIKLIDYAAEQLDLEGEIECSITFVDNARIQVINRDYRGIDRPTDVISFALEEMDENEVPILPEEGEPRVLGDIIISVERTHEQAAEYNHSFERELGFLVIHGLLHLLGYDHQNAEQEKEMFGLQESILSSFGLSRD